MVISVLANWRLLHKTSISIDRQSYVCVTPLHIDGGLHTQQRKAATSTRWSRAGLLTAKRELLDIESEDADTFVNSKFIARIYRSASAIERVIDS